MNDTTQIKTWQTKEVFWSVVKVLFGGVLGATAYLLTAKVIVDQSTYLGCSPEFFHSVIEASKFPAWILVSPIMSPESRFYQPVQYLLASIPYAVFGAFIALGSKKVVILTVGILTVSFLCVSWLLYEFFMGFMCG